MTLQPALDLVQLISMEGQGHVICLHSLGCQTLDHQDRVNELSCGSQAGGPWLLQTTSAGQQRHTH